MINSGEKAVAGRGSRVSHAACTIVMVALFVISLSSCGYRFQGDRNPVIDVQTVHIPPMHNTTTKVGIETQFTNDLIFEVNRSGHS
jgi:hypothetical protein